MTKYQYEEGKTYLSESTPITVSRIPSGTYKISVKYGEAKGEQLFTSTPGTQKVSIMASNNDWDLSGAYVTYVTPNNVQFTFTAGGITGSSPVCAKIGIENAMSSIGNGPIEATVSNNNPNMTIPTSYGGSGIQSICTIRLYDSDGNIIAERSDVSLSKS